MKKYIHLINNTKSEKSDITERIIRFHTILRNNIRGYRIFCINRSSGVFWKDEAETIIVYTHSSWRILKQYDTIEEVLMKNPELILT